MKAFLFCLLLMQAVAGSGQAQQTKKNEELRREGRKVARQLEERYSASRQRALQLARRHGWAISETDKSGRTLSLQGLDERGMPVYYVTYNSNPAAATTSTDQVWKGGAANLSLSGNNPALAGKLGIWDGGRVRASHQELVGRVVARDGAATVDNHATHVAGTMMASGLDPAAKGMAFAAPNLQSWDFNFDIPEIAAAADQLLVSNHSYGSTAGWRYNGNRNPQWEWWGDITVSELEDNKFGQYNYQSRDFDQIAYYAPYYLMVKAAGNNRTETGPAVGSPYWRINAARTAWELASARAAGMSSNNGYGTIPTYGNAKNMLMVGAVSPIPAGYQQPSDVQISSFSSWGPTDDGRIKPDLVGNGVKVYSSIGTGDASYASYNGTSMASPNVAGSLFLLQEHYANLHGGAFMRAATLKGLAIHTADEAGPAPGPDYTHGWGLLNTRKAAAVITNADGRHSLAERELHQNESFSFPVTADGTGPLVVTISWTDPEGATASTTLLNDRTPKLVNDLDVRVTRGLEEYQPWVLDPANPSFAATFGDNFRDNVEQVFIANPVAGETYTITVRHKGVLQRGPQAYSVVVSGIRSTLYCISQALSPNDTRISQAVLGSIRHTPVGCATYRDLTTLVARVQAGQSVPFSFTLGTCGADAPKAARLFADWNGDGDFEDAGELLASSGMVTGTADFSGAFPVPAALVKIGDTPRLRVVLVEAVQPEQVQPCGTYPKGETQDYLLKIVPPSADVGVAGLVFPAEGFCANPSQAVAVKIRNFGSTAQTGIAVRTEVRDETGTSVAVLEGTFAQTLAPLRETTLTLPGTFEAKANQTYTIVSTTSLAADQDPSNDTFTATRTTGGEVPAPGATASFCSTGPVALSASGEGTVFWYDAPAGGNLLGTGPRVSTDARPADNTYYAAFNDFSGRFGPSSKYAFQGGGYSQYVTEVYFSAQVPLVLEKARLYIGNPGRIIFDVYRAGGGELVSTVSLDVAATRTPAGPNSQPNDPSDQGAVHDLNLTFPEAGDYVVKISYLYGATIFRNNIGVTGYPFTIPGVVSLTGNSISTYFYYYFYDLQVKALGCASARVPVVAQEATPPIATISLSGPAVICQGEGVVLQVPLQEACTYQWQKDGEAIAGAVAHNFEATAPGAYSVTVTNPHSPAACSQSSSAVVTVTAQASAVAGTVASPPAVCAGANAGTLELSGQTGPVLGWESSPDGETWTTIPSASPSLTFTGLSRTTRFRAVVGNGECQPLRSEPATVEVVPLSSSQITASGPTSFCEGQSVTLTASEGDSFLWSTGETSSSITVTADGSYWVEVKNRLGCAVRSEAVSVTVQPLPQPTVSTSGPAVFCEGGSVELTATAGEAYRWSTGETTRSITARTAGAYTVAVTNAAGCQTVSEPVVVTVLSQPVSTITASGPTSFCQGGQVTLTAGEGNETRWSTGQTTRSITVTQAGEYWVKVRNENGCETVSAKVAVQVAPQPVANAGADVSLCPGGSTVLQASGGVTYSWSPTVGLSAADVANPTVSPAQTTTYTVTVTNAEGCSSSDQVTVEVTPAPLATVTADGPTSFCAGGRVTLTASPASRYHWSTGQTTQSITVATEGAYTVTVSDEKGCSATSGPEAVTVWALPVANITAEGPTTFCEGGSVVLTASLGSNYRWSTGETTRSIRASATGDYTVTVTGEHGCAASAAPVRVVAEPAPTNNTVAGGQAVCLGAVPTALAGSEPIGNSGPYAYLWESSTAGPDAGFSPAPGFNKGVHYAPQAVTQPTWFRRRVYSGTCESTSEAVFISVKMPPSASVAQSGATTFCQGGSTVLTAQGGSKYRWSTGATTPSITVAESGTYTATVFSEDDCSTTATSVTVTVNPLPTPPSVTADGNRLRSSQSTGNQWYRHGKAIEGATGQELAVFLAGAYTVVSTQNGCSSTPSVPLYYKGQLDETSLKLVVSPNPNDGHFKLTFEVQGWEQGQLRLLTTLGQEVYLQQLPNLTGPQTVEVETRYLKAGLYLAQLRFGEKSFIRKVVIKQ